MINKFKKRTGEIEVWDPSKITGAIYKAVINTRDISEAAALEISELATKMIEFKINNKYDDLVELEQVQNIVEETLMEMNLFDIARSYVRFRFQKEQLRADEKAAISVKKMMANYINQSDWQVKENSNMDYSLQGLNNYIVSDITKSFWLNHVFSTEQKEAHINGDLHIHDLGLLSTYCCGWDLEDILKSGFMGVKNKVQSKPPKHFRAALGQIVNFLYSLQGEAAGAQAISSFDTYLAPFVHHDKLEYKDVKQAMQEFIFNLNVPTRVGFQTPFVNLTMDLIVPNNLKDQPIILGGKLQESTYGEFQAEMDMINLAFCEVMQAGDASGRIFTFPIPTYNITKNFNWDNKVVDEIMKMTSKYGIPYFANFINSDMDPEDARSMCCRLRLDNRELRKRGGGLFGANPLTGSIGVVTINLPRLGYLYKTEEELLNNLERLMNISKNILEQRRELIEKNTREGLYPYSRFYLRQVYERFNEYWKNHFNTIGINGMNECIRNFYNDQEDLTTEKGQAFAHRILDFMREEITSYQVDGNLYNLEATPAEGVSYRLARTDKELYPDIITAGTDDVYYTNSSQLPVGYTADIFEVLRLQDSLQTKYTGGTVLHAYLGERVEDSQVVKKLIKKIFENYELPYFSITPTFSICDDHGYITGEEFNCPTCNKETEVWTRVVGFYRPVQNFNKGKRSEYNERLEYVINK